MYQATNYCLTLCCQPLQHSVPGAVDKLALWTASIAGQVINWKCIAVCLSLQCIYLHINWLLGLERSLLLVVYGFVCD